MNKCTVTIMSIISFAFLITSGTCANSYASPSSPVIEYPSEDLPNLVMAYNYLIKGYGEKDDYINTKYQSLKNQLKFLSKLDANFEKIPEIYTFLVFSNLAFIVQNNISGYTSGFPAKESTITAPYKNIMFVTTPIKSINNNILIILSAVSPQYTAIVKVDEKLNVHLVFDSSKNILPDKTEVCSIVSVRVIKPDVFLLEERKENQCTDPGRQRYFTVDASTGSVIVSERITKP